MGLLVVALAILATLGYQHLTSATPWFSTLVRGDHHPAASQADGAVTAADGVLPDGVSVFDDQYPGIANLDPDLLRALREAVTDAAAGHASSRLSLPGRGITFYVNSGWRSPKYQNQLLREAIATYGSEAKAARWVATPKTSPHVSGDAVDLGPANATTWLSKHGARYGLCQIYRNEPWHYELRPRVADHGCPPTYADPGHDPRVRQ